jgi:hypothetical protein
MANTRPHHRYRPCATCGRTKRSHVPRCRQCYNTAPRPKTKWPPQVHARFLQLRGLPSGEIARALSKEFGARYTKHAVASHFETSGLLREAVGYSPMVVGQIMGVHGRTVASWIGRGLLRSIEWSPHNQHSSAHRVTEAAMRTFLYQHTWAYDWTLILEHHPWRQTARAAHERYPWLTCAQACQRLGCSVSTIRRYIQELSIITHERTRSLVLSERSVELIDRAMTRKWAERADRARRTFIARRKAAA